MKRSFLLLIISGGLPFLAAPSESTQLRRGLQLQISGGSMLTDVRTYDGTDNHPDDLGAVGTLLMRLSGPADYPPGDPSGETLLRDGPNPRDISNLVVDQEGHSVPSSSELTDATWAWGQFIDHDISLTDSSSANGAANIPVMDANDMLYPTIFFNRANHVMSNGVREPFNEITSFIDASQVYGSSQERASALREFSQGRLKTSSEGKLMPYNVDGLPNLGDSPDLFLGGDIRANENVVLTSLHTLFVREHNRLVERLRSMDGSADDEGLYQLARKIVNAEIQKITYEEFLPSLLGPSAPAGVQTNYDPNIHPGVANEFSAALFRVGHTLLSSELMVGDDKDGQETLPLKDAFTNADFIRNNPQNIGRLLRGLSMQMCQQVDHMIVDDVRTFLFLPPPFAVGLDLAALNIQRGRDQGLPVYNRVREAYGLLPATEFSDISSNPTVQDKLAEAYDSVDEVDAWVGGITEDHLEGANVGPLVAAALVDQFTRLRDGDRFFYTSDTDLDQSFIQNYIKQVTFGRLIRWNTDEETPDGMFFMKKNEECGCQTN